MFHELPIGSRAIDRTGHIYGGVTVVSKAPTLAKNSRWRVRGECDHEWIVAAPTLVTAEESGTLVRCPVCWEQRPPAAGRRRRVGRKLGPIAPRDPSKSPMCPRCFDLSWHRDPDWGCICGKSYAPEPPVTLDDILAQPREDRRVGMGGAW